MASKQKVKAEKTLRTACWRRGITVVELCRRVGVTRQTAYEAWRMPELFPKAAPKIFTELGIHSNGKTQSN